MMGRIYDEFRTQGFEIVAIDLREDTPRVTQFVRDADIHFPVLLDASGEVAAAYFVRAIPTSVFVDDQGVVRIVHMGTLTEDRLRTYIATMMHP